MMLQTQNLTSHLFRLAVVYVVGQTSLWASETHQWPHWRGPSANGVAPDADPPIHWNASHNVQWKAKIPGEGSATPIVWGQQVFVVTAIPTDREADQAPAIHPDARTRPPSRFYQFVVYCFDLETGQVIWRRVAREAVPHEGRHQTNTYASGSPTTDGERLYVSFGSVGLFCYDLSGQLQWERDLGNLRTRRGWGEAVTPVVHGTTLVVNWDQEEDSSVVALDTVTGEVRWRTPRTEKTSWNTPLVAPRGGGHQVIVNGANRVRSYALDSGELLWECGGQTVNPIPSPLLHKDVVYCLSGYRGAAAYAIPTNVNGDVSNSDQIIWKYGEGTPYVPSPLILGEQIYFTKANRGILTSLDASNGQPVFGPVRLNGIANLYASPVAAAGRIYFVSREGTTVVLQHGKELKVLATNSIDEPVDASPVLVGRKLLLRSAQHLYCIEEGS